MQTNMCSKMHFLLTVLGAFSIASATIVQKCAVDVPAIDIDIKDCEVEPCMLNGTALMHITFKAPFNSYTLFPKVRAKVGPITVTYPMPGDLADGCLSLIGSYCPIEKDEILVYQLAMPVDTFPKVNVLLDFSLLGDDNEVVLCFKVDCKVV